MNDFDLWRSELGTWTEIRAALGAIWDLNSTTIVAMLLLGLGVYALRTDIVKVAATS